MPGASGHVVLAGHRDTWAAFLKELRSGDLVILRTRGGEQRLRVVETEVVDRSRGDLLDAALGDRLTLLTCYPFDSLVRGRQRYIVTCLPDGTTLALPRHGQLGPPAI
jgi:sortase A